ncbi:MAG: SbmA/BacA-like family transporter [bacterium]
MEEPGIHIDRHAWNRMKQNVQRFMASEEAGRTAKWFFALLLLFMFGTNGLSVLNSYVNRAFMTSIEDRDHAEFIRMGLIYVGVFAASTLVSVIYTYTEQRLGLLWRDWATRQMLFRYASHRVYFGLKEKGEIGNPDQRISDDVRSFTTSSLSFLLMVLNGTFTLIAFSGVMWSISPLLFLVAILYAVAGTLLTYLAGRPLMRLNYNQMDKEANFRSSLTYLRANAGSVALSRREGGLIQLGLRNLHDLVANYRRIIGINRNVNFFTTGYNWMIQIIPALIVAPMFIDGKVEFGVITQSAIAFTQLVGAFSLIVREFQSLSSYAATSARLAALADASEREQTAVLNDSTFFRDENRVAYQELTLRSPRSDRVLIQGLSIDIPKGRHVLVRASDETARVSLFQATAGLWEVSEGHIVRPSLDQILFLPELPYLPPSTIRELLLGPWPEEEAPVERHLQAIQIPEERMLDVLRTLKIDSLLIGFGGLDTRHHWENTLPLDQQKLLGVARVLAARPRFAFLDRPSSTLDREQVDWLLRLLKERGISYAVFEEDSIRVSLENYDSLLELKAGGAWEWKTVQSGQIVDRKPSAVA